MASGDSVVEVAAIVPSETLAATLGTRSGGSGPAEGPRIWQFGADAAVHLDYYCWLRGYGGGGLTVRLAWSAAIADNNVCRWQCGIRRLQADVTDIDVSHSYSYQFVDATAPTVNGSLRYPEITFADGAQMNGWANDELAVLRFRRDAANAADTMLGNAEFWAARFNET